MSDITAADRPIVCQLESAVGGHSRPKLAVPAMSGLAPLATGSPRSAQAGSCTSDERFDRVENELRYCNMKFGPMSPVGQTQGKQISSGMPH